MRKLSFLLLFTLLCAGAAMAQGVPQGMRYQAVARDLKGEVMANAKVELRISLFSKKESTVVTHYTEIHSVVTNELGLFTLVAGQGKPESGEFDKVPWSTSDIWMEIQIRTGSDPGFSVISNSQLLTVPYAFYAATAGDLLKSAMENTGTAAKELPETCSCDEGVSQVTVLYRGPSNVTVNVYRNKNLTELLNSFSNVASGAVLTVNSTNYPDGKLKDNTYFQVMSPGIPVMELPTKCDDPIVGENFGSFSVLSRRDKKNNLLCSVCDVRTNWHVGGNGLMDLCNLLGTKSNTDLVFITNNIERLRISKNGDINIAAKLDIGSDLTVQGNVNLNTVYGSTTNNGPLTVANSSATSLTGTLGVTGATTLGNSLSVTNSSPTNLSGTLTVNGATAVNNSLTVSTNSANHVASFVNTNNGDGDGIVIKLGKTHPMWTGSAYVNIPNPTTQGVQTQMDQIRDWIYGNDNFSWDDLINLMPSQYLTGTVCNLTNYITTNINNALNLPLKIGPYTTPATHIWNETQIFGGIDLGALGSIPRLAIPALDIPALPVLPEVTVMPRLPQLNCTGLPSLSFPVIAFDNVNNSLTKNNEFVSFVDKDNRKLGAIRAQSIQNFSYDYFDGQKMLDLAAEFIGIDIVDDFMSIVSGISQMVQDYNSIGVEYSSGNGDYAEWLERENPSEEISYGDIVGVKGGRITRDLKDAQQVMAVSKRPIVLGNMPDKDRVVNGNNIAFMGQIPVKVMGPVQSGDYIVAKSGIPGYGIAVHPQDMTTEDFRLAVGRSWDSNLKTGPKMVNTVVGVHNHDFLNIIGKLQQKADRSEERLNAIERVLGLNSGEPVKDKPKKAFK